MRSLTSTTASGRAPRRKLSTGSFPTDAADVLEIGAGTGLLTRLLAERVPHLMAIEPDERMRAVLTAKDARVEVLAGHGRADPCPLVIRRRRHCRSRRGTGWTRHVRSRRWHGSCGPVGGSRSCGPVPTAPSTGCVHCGPGGSSSARRRGPTRTLAAGGGTWSTSTSVATARSSSPRRRSSTGPEPMTKADLVALSATYSAVITMEEGARRAHLEGMTRFLDDARGVRRSSTPSTSPCAPTAGGPRSAESSGVDAAPCAAADLRALPEDASTPWPRGRRGRTPPARRAHRRCGPPPRRARAGASGRTAGRSRPGPDRRRRSR